MQVVAWLSTSTQLCQCISGVWMFVDALYVTWDSIFVFLPNVCVQTESKASFRCRAIIHKRKDSMHAHNQKNVGKTWKMVHKTSTQSWGKQSPSDCDTSKKSKARVSNSFYTQPALILNEPDHLNSPLSMQSNLTIRLMPKIS